MYNTYLIVNYLENCEESGISSFRYYKTILRILVVRQVTFACAKQRTSLSKTVRLVYVHYSSTLIHFYRGDLLMICPKLLKCSNHISIFNLKRLFINLLKCRFYGLIIFKSLCSVSETLLRCRMGNFQLLLLVCI